MKKLFMLLALVLGVVSCQNDPEGFGVVVGGEQDVNITVSLPESTRGDSADGFDLSKLSDLGYELRYILEIYLDGGDDNKRFREVKYSDATTVSFPVRLAPSREYHFAVWADLVKKVADREEGADADYYYVTSNGLKNITIDVTKWTPNVEARDAFYGKAALTMEQSIANLPTIKLTRPFAKVRVVATDINDITKFGIEPDNATVSYTAGMCKSFNAVEGTAGDPTTTTTSINYDIVKEAYSADAAAGQLTVFADYILVPESGTVQFSLDVNATNGLIKSNSFNTAIPVEANKVTSIVGDVLTEGGNVSIKIDGTLGEKETINYVDTVESLQEIINRAEDNKPTTIILGGNVVINNTTTRAESQYGLIIPANKVIILDLNGFTISQTKECANSYSMIENRGTLTINDSSEANSGLISFKDTSAGDPTYHWGSYTISNYGGTLVVENGTIKHLGEQDAHMICAIWQYNGSTTINGGVISTPNYRSARLWSGNMTINGGVFEGQLWLQASDNNAKLTINGGRFAPRGNDSSSVYVTNSGKRVQFAVTDGYFETKIGMSEPFGCITGGTFTTAAKEGTNAALLGNGYAFVEGENGIWGIDSLGYYIDGKGNYHIQNAKGWLWMADQSDTFFGSKTVFLDNDIDFADVKIKVTKMQTPEYFATFDGQNHTIRNVWMGYDYASYNQALFDGHLNIINLNVESTEVYGQSAVGIIGANIYGNITNCHVRNSRAYGYVWQVGGIVGLHSWGEIKDCSVEDTKIECYYYGAVGAIAGCMNDASRNIKNCTVKNCKLKKEGIGYADYDGLFGAFAGYVLTSGNHTFSGKIENTTTTVNGITTDSKVYGESEGTVVYNDTHYVASTDALTSAISAGATEFMLNEGIYVIPSSAAGKTLHFTGVGNAANTKIATNNETGSYEGCNYNLSGSTVTFENISINTTSTSYIGYAGCKATYKNCIINGYYCLYDNSSFEDCTFNVSGDTYNIWTWSAPVATFTRCTFNCDGKSVMLYGGANTTLTINDCTFNDLGGLDELKAAIEIGNDYGTSYELIVNNTTVNGFAINNKGINTGTTLWANKNSMPQDKLNVVVDGVDVY